MASGRKGAEPSSAAAALPRVDAIARELERAGASPHHAVRVEGARQAIAAARAALLAGEPVPSQAAIIARATAWIAARAQPMLQRVINATGVIVHTNLGRAPLPAEAVASALGYCNLEYDLGTGERGSRRSHIEPLLVELSGAEAALVVNNCAAALVLALASLPPQTSLGTVAQGRSREVIVSRGELVEIGGSFRIPEILASAGVTLCEVGTTNRTYASDYAAAIGPGTVAVLRVHPSNFKLSGFIARPSLNELATMSQAAGLPFLVDLGSDPMLPLSAVSASAFVAGKPALAADPGDDTLAAALAAGADIVMFSGDKLIGGPQAGLVLGRRTPLDRMARHPLMRALRPDKLALAALEYVLRARASGSLERVPVLYMASLDRAHLRVRAERLGASLNEADIASEIVATADPIGGGSHPEATLPGAGLALCLPTRAAADSVATLPQSLDQWHARLRQGRPPVIATLAKDRLVIALRTVPEADERDLIQAIISSLDTPTSLI